MSIHDQLRDLINQLSEEDVKKVIEYVKEVVIEEYIPTEEEIKAIEEAEAEIERGEYVTLDELFGKEE